MEKLNEYMREYKSQLEKGVLQKAYKGLMEYMMGLKIYLKKKYPDYYISSNIYFGYMDMTYFSFTPKSLKDQHLKIALVFLHEACRFEVWLGGSNKEVQIQTWNKIKESDWEKYPLVPTTQGYDSIVEQILVEDPDFGDLDTLTKQIEEETLIFIEDMEDFLSQH
jgi:hypothetical protein